MRKEKHAQLKAYADATGTSMSQIVTGWIDDYLDAVERSKKQAALAANRTVAQLGMSWPTMGERNAQAARTSEALQEVARMDDGEE